jgi:hypothetical protein
MIASTFPSLSPKNEKKYREAKRRYARQGFEVSIQGDRLHLEASSADYSYDALLTKHSSPYDGELSLGDFVTTAFYKFAFETLCPECPDVLEHRRTREFIVCSPHGIEGDAIYSDRDGFELYLRVFDEDEFVFARPFFSSWPTAQEIKDRLQTVIKDYTASLIFIKFLNENKLKGEVSKNFVTVFDHRMAVRFENGEPRIDLEEKLSHAELKKAIQLLDDFKAYKAKSKPNDSKAEEERMESEGLDLV